MLLFLTASVFQSGCNITLLAEIREGSNFTTSSQTHQGLLFYYTHPK
jgi:hypothetical protein